MKTALLLHGTCDKEEYFSDKYPSLSNSHWFPWLQKQLLMRGVFTQTPEMPDAYKPDYKKWKREFERFDVDKDTILVGHSCGGGFLVRYLSEHKLKIKKLILVAPWMDPNNKKAASFFDFTIDPKLEDRAKEMFILVSEDEEVDGVKETVGILSEKFHEARLIQFDKMGHFTLGEMKTDKFPELLKLILK
ncbi:alpha/beta fold hydrolase [Candidatus Dojkabacteria bacterium]|nr:alpha/beta fold hydrolase [Candidatus Dojkabacteria bacterium]